MHDDIEALFETIDVVWPLEVAERLRLLIPLLERGFDTRQRLDEQRAGLEAVLERVRTAVFTLGGDMSLQYANPAGEALLRRADGLVLKGRFVTARWTTDARALTAAAMFPPGVRAGEASPVSAQGRVVTIRRTGNLAPYRATLLPLRRERAIHALTPLAEILLFIDDPDTADVATPADEALFRQAFRLTPAEARLAACLASGESLASAAETYGITRNTARAQLQAIFDKTEARRQSDLVRLLQAVRSLRVSHS
jgi:DNA-binding CsgD family transcriptional regulator